MEIKIRELKKVNLEGGIVIDGFPTAGLANAIASECIIESLELEPVSLIDSDMFPAMATVYKSVPYFPARIHANEKLKLAIFISELTLENPALLKGIGKTIIQWANEQMCSLVYSVAGQPVEDEKKQDMEVLGIGNSMKALELIRKNNVPILEHGGITGVPGVLLTEGLLNGVDVIVFLVKVLKDVPDFRAAAMISEILSHFAPACRCNVESLITEAEKVEKRLRKIRTEGKTVSDMMYR